MFPSPHDLAYIMTNNHFQGIAFYTAIGAASAEVLTLVTLAMSALRSSVKYSDPEPMIQLRDKKHSISSGSQLPFKPRKRSPSTL